MKTIQRRRLVIFSRLRLMQELLSHALSQVEGWEVVGIVSRTEEVLLHCANQKVDVLLLESPIAAVTAEVMQRLRAQGVEVSTLCLSLFAKAGPANAMLGGDATVTGADSLEMLMEALGLVARGGMYFSPTCQYERTEGVLLTEKQRTVLRLVVGGASTKEVARQLGITYKTADHHRSRLMRKLKVHSAVELVRYALDHGLAEAS